jgi:NAD-dependent SIR2 family protein deacetylase
MKYPDIKNVVAHILQTCKCIQCKAEYVSNDVDMIASTKTEGLFETRCKKCNCTTIITVVLTPKVEIKKGKITDKYYAKSHNGISENDILDMKNFLNRFDGDFKKIFTNQE